MQFLKVGETLLSIRSIKNQHQGTKTQDHEEKLKRLAPLDRKDKNKVSQISTKSFRLDALANAGTTKGFCRTSSVEIWRTRMSGDEN
ncbi:hypothetical protein JXA02_14390 [candidate division KSB1 bacterium]|nr:hypothetical protein [candidate division KSB1 bacterium]